jgi:hypothetical protein
MPPRIFIPVAAYRDRDCVNTIEDLFAKASWPERIFVGVCWQTAAADRDDGDPLGRRGAQCRLLTFDAVESKGVGWARHHAQSLWRGEEYVLQIDSHMRFAAGWDDALITMLGRCPSDRPIVSTYPAAFTPPDRIESHVVAVIHLSGFDSDGLPRQESVGYAPHRLSAGPRPTAFVSGGFLFGDSRWIAEVPNDPFIYFQGEEIALAARLFTHGWDVFVPTEVLAYHDYNQETGRPRHWQDCATWATLNQRSLRRVRHLLGIESSHDAEVLRDLGRYGLGRQRSLADYERFAGVNFRSRLQSNS